MQWDTVERGKIQFNHDTGLDVEAGRGEVGWWVYRALTDGKWHACGRHDMTGNLGWHNVGAPALYAYWNGEPSKLSLWWGRLGKPHRVDGPAHAEFHDTSRGNWYLAGRLHRIEGPASGGWHLNSVVVAARAWQRRARRLRWLGRHVPRA